MNNGVTFFKTQKLKFDVKAGEDFTVNLRTGEVLRESLPLGSRLESAFEERVKTMTADPVNHPSHYNSGKIEVIEAIEDWGLGFHAGNVVKYMARAGKKDPTKEIEDIEKAIWYAKRRVEILKAKRDGRDAVKPNDMNRPKMISMESPYYGGKGEMVRPAENKGTGGGHDMGGTFT